MSFIRAALLMLLSVIGPAHAQAQTASDPQLEAGKARVIETLNALIEEQQQSMRTGGLGDTRLGRLYRGLVAPQRAFLRTVERTPAPQLPTLLADTFLGCSAGRCRDGLGPYDTEQLVAAFGLPALQELLRRFPQADAFAKERMLFVSLRVAPAPCPMPLLDSALADGEFRVRAAAIRVLRKNCEAQAFLDRLDQQLARESNPEFLLYLLDEVPQEAGVRSGWAFNRLVRLVQQGRLPVAQAFGKLCAEPAASSAPLQTADVDVSFWLGTLQAHPLQQRCLVRSLFLKLEREDQLIPLRPLFRAAANHRFGFDAVQGLFDVTTRPPWNGYAQDDDKLLALFQARLRPATLQAWLREPGTPLGERALLARWLGQPPASVLPAALRLRIEVRSPAGAVAASTLQPVRLDQPFSFTVAPTAPGFQQMHYQGTLRLDAQALRYRIDGFVVGIQPAGAGFDARIPLTGSLQTQLVVQGQDFLWKITVEGEAGGQDRRT